MAKNKKYKPTKFMAKTSHYDGTLADYAVAFIEQLCHTKGTWSGSKFNLLLSNVRLFKDSLVKIIGDIFDSYDSIINLFGGQCQII